MKKINAYNICGCSDSIIEFQDEYFKKVISEFTRNENADVDNILLWEIYCNNFDLLITDDKEMLIKAEKLFIRENVKTSAEMLQQYEKSLPIQHIEYQMLSVKLKEFSAVNLNDHFFNTLREDYEGKKFDDWFKRKAKNEEKAYVFQNKEGLLKAFLYIKKEESSENYDDIEPVLAPKKRLKIGTFKVDTEKGFRLGERFLKIIFNNAIKQDVEEIYVTLFENKRKEVTRLRDMMKKWGFEYHGEKISNKESVFVKKLKSYNPFKSPKFNFPNIQKNAESYILPISSEFHTKLFPDNILTNEDMTLYKENLGQYYALEKIYLTKAPNILAKKGDLILIYRMGERCPKKYSSAITGIAIIEDIIRPKTIQNCIETCKNKSVFSVQEIRKIYSRDWRNLIIIKLLDYKTFNKKVILKKLHDLNVVNRGEGPRPFTKISKKQHDEIIKLGGIN